jgi:predicted RNA-binding Zn ribbon-like protein
MQFPFISGHAALDFLNTSFTPEGEIVETIASGRAWLDWCVAVQLIDEPAAARLAKRVGMRSLDVAAGDARKLREWAEEWLQQWRERPRGDYREQVAALNKLMARGASYSRLEQLREGFALTTHASLDDADALLALVASQLAHLFAEERPDLVKRCAGEKCSLWFLDRTKAHRRVFCSASACGNRAKVAAYRQRQRAEAQ